MVFFVLFLFLISVLTTPGFAQTVYQETDAWQVSAIGSGEEFDSCLAVNRFDPYSLEFRYADGDIFLDLTGSAARLDRPRSIVLRVDRRSVQVSARPLTPDTIRISLDNTLYGHLIEGENLLLRVSGTTLRFSLAESGDALIRLRQCATARGVGFVSSEEGYEPSIEWQVNAIGADDAFSYCVTENFFDNRYILAFIRREDNETILILGIQGQQFASEQSIPITLRIDQRLTRNITALPTNPEALSLTLGNDAQLYRGLLAGSILTLELPEETLSFRLQGLRLALTQLQQCGSQKGQGFAQRTLQEEPPTLPEETVQTVNQIIRALGMYNIPRIRDNRFTGWVFGPLTPVGTIEILPNPNQISLSALVEQIVSDVESRCQGRLEVEIKEEEAVSSDSLQLIDTVCTTTQASNYIGFLLHNTVDILLIYTVESSVVQTFWSQSVLNQVADQIRQTITATVP